MTQPYSVKSVSVIRKAEGLLEREFVFAPGEATPWHRHSEVTDVTCPAEGRIWLETRGEAPRELAHPDRATTLPGAVHRLVNRSDADCRLVLIQHGGKYDFIVEA
ncbi:MAG TPA: cupin domain-containing protein [Caulobacteraceae bacterium]|nr:cupin domain-containing protein [Caulobacteraceae bacterium]